MTKKKESTPSKSVQRRLKLQNTKDDDSTTSTVESSFLDTTPVPNTYRVSQPVILFVTGQTDNPQHVVDAFNKMLEAFELIKSPAMQFARVGDVATTLIVTGDAHEPSE